MYTDHSAVRAVLEMPNPSGKYARWWTKVYESGVKTINISIGQERTMRMPMPYLVPEVDDEIQVVAI